ncbi:MAG: hypothetical protein AAFQ98_18165 [Bacteroidota bacterium]
MKPLCFLSVAFWLIIPWCKAQAQGALFWVIDAEAVVIVSTGEEVKVGREFYQPQSLRLGPNGYLALYNADGAYRVWEGPQTIADSMLEEFSPTGRTLNLRLTWEALMHDQPYAREAQPQAIHAGYDPPPDIPLILPVRNEIKVLYKEICLWWETDSLHPTEPYKLLIYNLFDEPLDSLYVPGNRVQLDLSSYDEDVLFQIQILGHQGKTSDRIYVIMVPPEERQQAALSYTACDPKDPMQALVMAYYLERKANSAQYALPYYQLAAELSGRESFRVFLEQFRARYRQADWWKKE